MKRFLCFFLAFVIIVGISLPNLSLVVFAENTYAEEQSQKDEKVIDIRDEKGVSFSCYFDPASYSLNLGGTVNHDLLIKYRDYTVAIYAIPLGKEVKEIVFDPNITSIAETPIAVRFQFSKKIEHIVEKYYSYCAVLCSPDGERVLATDSHCAEVTSTFKYDANDRVAYKGIESELISSASNTGAGRIVVPLLLNKLISEDSSGYVYQTYSENIYFEKSYIEMLDAKVRTATEAGVEVYFRILVDGFGGGVSIRHENATEDVRYYMPDIYDEKTLTRVESAVSFLTERYENIQSGKISGFVAGSMIDVKEYNYIMLERDAQYADIYALYIVLIANSARQIRSDIDIVIPFSDKNIFKDTSEPVLETLIKKFDQLFSSELNFSVMIESGISPIIANKDREFSLLDSDERLYAQNIKLFEEYLNRLEKKYKSAPISFNFVWRVPNELRSNELSAAYAYSYLKLADCKKMSSFIVCLADSEVSGDYGKFNDLKNIFEYIDTSNRENVLSNILAMFGKGSWQELIDKKELISPITRKNINLPVSDLLPNEWKGSFSYFDFSTSVSLSDWYKGVSCGALRLDHGSGGTSLRVDMTASKFGEYSEVLCLYEYPESLKYTPYLAFRCKVENGKADNSLFEIVVSGGQNTDRMSASHTVHSGEEAIIVLDVSKYVNGLTDSWKIGVRALDGNTEEFSLNVYDIVGYSMEYSSEDLANKIEEERLRIRNQAQISENESNASTITSIITIAILVISLGIGVFVCIRMGDSDSEHDNVEEAKKKK